MKKILLALALVFIFTANHAQDKARKIPSASVKTLNGKTINTSSLSNDGNPMVISFWATWCSPCKKELNEILEVYEDWQDETGVKLVAVSIDDSRNTHKVAPYVNGKGWEYQVLLDPNGDFKRAMSVNNVPHTFLVDGSGKIVWQNSGYCDEETLYEQVQKYSK